MHLAGKMCFRVPDKPGRPKVVYFRTGQPLGLYASWPLLTLTHHLAVQFVAQRAGLKLPFRDYALLGDDIDICHSQVAKGYLALMEAMDVSISEAKSIVSDNGSAEFAKRFIWSYRGVSPLSAKWIAGVNHTLLLSPLLTRVRDFREVRLSEALRLSGKGPSSSPLIYLEKKRAKKGMLQNQVPPRDNESMVF